MFRVPFQYLIIAVCLAVQTPYFCENGNAECFDAGNACHVYVNFGSRDQVAWSFVLNSHAQYLGSIQNSMECGCDHSCCCCDGPHTCSKWRLEIASNCRKKPNTPLKRWYNGTSIALNCQPTSQILGDSSQVPSITSNAVRCSLLCRFLL